jgi:O-methyltransferase
VQIKKIIKKLLYNTVFKWILRIPSFKNFIEFKRINLNSINDLNPSELKILEYVFQNQLTMTSKENLASTILAARYIVKNNVAGDFVECGVWRGGHGIAAALTFSLYNSDKKIICFDTFKGMTEPISLDIKLSTGEQASEEFFLSKREEHNVWCYASIDEVRENFNRAGVKNDKFELIQGDVIKTLLKFKNKKISFLRLDTDWYESTKKELELLYPKLSNYGVLVIDDYGYWAGSKKAVDEFTEISHLYLHSIDEHARIALKLPQNN